MENNNTPVSPIRPEADSKCRAGQVKPPNATPTDCNMMPGCMSRIGYAYVPFQTFNDIYPPAEGLSRGTIFPELDKPFGMYGAEVG